MNTVKAKPAKAKTTAKVGKNTKSKKEKVGMISPKKIKGKLDELDIIDPLDDDEVEEEPHAELDPEVIEALNIKKKTKVKGVKAVDYIPELEREDTMLDDSFGGNM